MTAPQLSPAQARKIRLMSDNELYTAALAFVADNRPPASSQLNGLRAFSARFDDLDQFIKHQRDRDRPNMTAHYKDFYTALAARLQEFKRRAEEFVPEGLTRAMRQEHGAFYASLIAQPFIEHVVAEALLVEASSRRPRPGG